jgi:hypothetical protein
MSIPKPINNKRRYKSGGKFNPKDIDSMTVKELRETYDSAKAFVSACETTFSSMIGIYNQQKINSNISNSIYNDEPLLGGSVGKTFGDYNEYDSYGMPNVYAPPEDIIDRVSVLPLNTESYIPENNNNNNNNNSEDDIEDELNNSIKNQIAELLLKQQQLEQQQQQLEQG